MKEDPDKVRFMRTQKALYKHWLLHDTINVHKGELMEYKNQTENHGYRSNEDKKCHGWFQHFCRSL